MQSVNGPDVTAIMGMGASRPSPYFIRCAYLTNGAMVSGFTLTNGSTLATNDLISESGGGIWCEGNGSIVSNCIIVGNLAQAYGGGAFRGTMLNCILTNNSGGSGGAACSNVLVNCTLIKNITAELSSLFGGGAYFCTLSNCLIVGNQGKNGGGAYFSTLTGCTVSNNFATSGGGLFFGTASNCLISSNRATSFGGGAFSNTLASCTLQNNNSSTGGGGYICVLKDCNIFNNAATNSGGGVYRSKAVNCVLSGNSAGGNQNGIGDGGGASFSALTNCLLTGNFAKDAGGGAYLCRSLDGSINLVNCTIVSNTAVGFDGSVSDCNVMNSIIYYNFLNYTNDDVSGLNGGNRFNNCCVSFTNVGSFVNSFTNPPFFANSAVSDFHLDSNSPCINSGSDSYVKNTSDLDGNPRIVGGTVDIGAYEYQTPSSTLSYAWAQQYGLPTDGSGDNLDTDGDGMNNYAEWKAGTNPTNSLSLLELSAPIVTVTNATVTWQSVSGISYYVQRSSDLTMPFTSIVSDIVGQAGTTSYTDASATNNAPYFYRVGVQ